MLDNFMQGILNLLWLFNISKILCSLFGNFRLSVKTSNNLFLYDHINRVRFL